MEKNDTKDNFVHIQKNKSQVKAGKSEVPNVELQLPNKSQHAPHQMQCHPNNRVINYYIYKNYECFINLNLFVKTSF